MIFLITVAGIVGALVATGYVVLGRNRYGRVRPGNRLQLTANKGAIDQAALRPEPCRTVRVYFIKPARYDEGYVQQFRWGVQPSNTLTTLAALNDSFNRRQSVDRNVHLETVIWDETCDGVISPQLSRR